MKSLLYAYPLLALGSVFANSLIVSPTGVDNSTCGSLASPCQSVNGALDRALAGDSILLRAQVQTNTRYSLNDPWNSEVTLRINNRKFPIDKPVVIRPYQDESVIFRGNGDFILQIRNCENLIIEGFEIEGEVERISMDSALAYQFQYKDQNGQIQWRAPQGSTPAQVETMTFAKLSFAQRPSLYSTIGLLVQQSKGIVIRQNHIHHTPGTGLRAFGSDYITLEDNRVHDCSRRSSVGNHGLVVEGATSVDNIDTAKIIIQRNQVYDNYNEIYSWSENKDFITPHIDEGKGISLQKNNLASGWTHGRILVLNNLTWGNGFSGIHNNEGDRTDIIYNTVYLNNRTAATGNNVGISVSGGDDARIQNNIVVSLPSQGFAISNASTSHVVLGKNLIQGDLDPDLENFASQQIFADPKFVDPYHANFKLQSNSPALGQAESCAWTSDYEQNSRKPKPDLGAYESTVQNTLIKDLTQREDLLDFLSKNSDWVITDAAGHLLCTSANKSAINLQNWAGAYLYSSQFKGRVPFQP